LESAKLAVEEELRETQAKLRRAESDVAEAQRNVELEKGQRERAETELGARITELETSLDTERDASSSYKDVITQKDNELSEMRDVEIPRWQQKAQRCKESMEEQEQEVAAVREQLVESYALSVQFEDRISEITASDKWQLGQVISVIGEVKRGLRDDRKDSQLKKSLADAEVHLSERKLSLSEWKESTDRDAISRKIMDANEDEEAEAGKELKKSDGKSIADRKVKARYTAAQIAVKRQREGLKAELVEAVEDIKRFKRELKETKENLSEELKHVKKEMAVSCDKISELENDKVKLLQEAAKYRQEFEEADFVAHLVQVSASRSDADIRAALHACEADLRASREKLDLKAVACDFAEGQVSLLTTNPNPNPNPNPN